MKKRTVVSVLSILTCIGVVGCGVWPGLAVPRSCLDIAAAPATPAEAPYVGFLAWESDGQRLLVDALAGPFSASPASDRFLRVSYPDGAVEPWFQVDAQGVAATPDGTVLWLGRGGIWERTADGHDATLVVPIPGAEEEGRRWTVTRDRIYVVRPGGSGAIDSFSRTGDTLASPFAADPANVDIWASWDGSQAVITRVLGDRRTVYVVTTGSGSWTVDPGIRIPTFEWLARGGQSLIILDFERGLMTLPVDGSAQATLVDSRLPADYRAITTPTSAGLIAYNDRDQPSSRVCFANLPLSAVP